MPITSREDITDHIRQYVEAGIINNRDDVIACLTEDVGIITRSAKHFVSVLPKNEKKAIRLRGLYFEQDFNTEPRPGATDAGQDDRTDFKGSKYVRPTTQGARDEFNAAYQRRRKFHIKRLQQAERNRSNRSVSVLAGAADSRPVLDPRPDAGQRDGHQCIDVDDRRTSPDAAANGTGDSEPEYGGHRHTEIPGQSLPDYTTWRTAPGRIPAPTVPRPMGREDRRGVTDGDDRVRNRTTSRSKPDSGGAQGNRPALREFDEAVEGFAAAVAGFAAAVAKYRALVAAIVERMIQRLRDENRVKERAAAHDHTAQSRTPPAPAPGR